MARVTGSEVLEIIDTVLIAAEITPFIAVATLIVDDVLSGAGYSVALEKEIERWLTAHFVAVRDPRVSQESFGGGSQRFHGESGMGFEHTPYGQQVLALDYKSYFKVVQSSSRRAELKVLV